MSKNLVLKLSLERDSDSPVIQPVPLHQPKGLSPHTAWGGGPQEVSMGVSATLELHLVLPRAAALLSSCKPTLCIPAAGYN